MFAKDIVIATEGLQHFGLRSKIYAYFFLCLSTLAIILWAIAGSITVNAILTGVCIMLLPTAIYFSGTEIMKLTDHILRCRAAAADQFDISFRGPFSGVSWILFAIAFLLACGEILLDFYYERAFGWYGVVLIFFTLLWLVRMYSYFSCLEHSVTALRGHAEAIDIKGVPRNQRGVVEEAKRGNTETIVDKRDTISSL